MSLIIGRRRTLDEKVEVYARGMGEPNIMIMCLIFILAGAFATIAKGSGAVDAAVTIAQSLVPATRRKSPSCWQCCRERCRAERFALRGEARSTPSAADLPQRY